jgi:hypothetical protein
MDWVKKEKKKALYKLFVPMKYQEPIFVKFNTFNKGYFWNKTVFEDYI